LLRALPRSYQVTPDIPDRRRATQQQKVTPAGRQPQTETARRPVGTNATASDVTDTPEAKQQASKRERGGMHFDAVYLLGPM
jgi:hypothetical protein